MVIREIWAIPGERIRRFFRTQDDVGLNENGGFSFRRCEIRVRELPEREIGSLRFPQTQMDFEGPAEETEEIHRRFVLQFVNILSHKLILLLLTLFKYHLFLRSSITRSEKSSSTVSESLTVRSPRLYPYFTTG